MARAASADFGKTHTPFAPRNQPLPKRVRTNQNDLKSKQLALALVIVSFASRSCSSTGPRFIAEDQERPPGTIAGHALLVVPEANGAETFDAKDMLGSMPQGAVTVRPAAKAAKAQAGRVTISVSVDIFFF